eukprot:3162617-Rhodomonas_salina.1
MPSHRMCSAPTQRARPPSANRLRLAVTGSPDLDCNGGTVLREQLGNKTLYLHTVQWIAGFFGSRQPNPKQEEEESGAEGTGSLDALPAFEYMTLCALPALEHTTLGALPVHCRLSNTHLSVPCRHSSTHHSAPCQHLRG